MRFDVLNDIENRIFADPPSETRHDRAKTGHDLRPRIYDGLPDVAFIRFRSPARLKLYRLTEEPDQRRTTRRVGGAVAVIAAELGKEPFAGGRHGDSGFSAGEPSVVFGLGHDDDRSHHAGVERAAVLIAEKMVLAGRRGLEPGDCIAPGNHIPFEPESGHAERVDDIFRSQYELQGLA